MALSLSDLKKNKPTSVKKVEEGISSSPPLRKKILPHQVGNFEDKIITSSKEIIGNTHLQSSFEKVNSENESITLKAQNSPPVEAQVDPHSDIGNFKIEHPRKPEVNDTQTSNKLVTDSEETSNKDDDSKNITSNKLVTNNEKTSNKLVTTIASKVHLNNLNEETSNKLVTDSKKTSNKLVTKNTQPQEKLETIEGETSNKLVTNDIEIEKRDVYSSKTSNKLVTTFGKTSNRTSNSTSNKLVTERPKNPSNLKHQNFSSLSGLNRKIILYIFDLCFKNSNTKEQNDSGPIGAQQLVENIGSNATSLRIMMLRLIKKNLLIKLSSKEGRGGHTVYKLPDHIYQEILYFSIGGNYKQTSNKLVTQLVTELVTTPSSQLDSNNINILTNSKESISPEFTPESEKSEKFQFKDLDFSKIPMIKAMMINTAIRKAVETNLEFDDVQMFINKFKNWISQQNRIQNPVAIFCEKLKELVAEGDSDVLYVLSDEELEAEMLLAQEIEQKRQQRLLIEKVQHEKEKAILLSTIEKEFETWVQTSDRLEKESLFKPNTFAEFGSERYNQILKSKYFEKFGFQ